MSPFGIGVGEGRGAVGVEGGGGRIVDDEPVATGGLSGSPADHTRRSCRRSGSPTCRPRCARSRAWCRCPEAARERKRPGSPHRALPEHGQGLLLERGQCRPGVGHRRAAAAAAGRATPSWLPTTPAVTARRRRPGTAAGSAACECRDPPRPAPARGRGSGPAAAVLGFTHGHITLKGDATGEIRPATTPLGSLRRAGPPKGSLRAGHLGEEPGLPGTRVSAVMVAVVSMVAVSLVTTAGSASAAPSLAIGGSIPAQVVAASAAAGTGWKPESATYGIGQRTDVPVTAGDGTVLSVQRVLPDQRQRASRRRGASSRCC